MSALIPCTSKRMAMAILKEMGIPFDRLYENVSWEKDWSTGLMKKRVPGVHLYFNNGDGLNVAYWTPVMGCMRTFEDLPNFGRIDGTPLENRQQYWLDDEDVAVADLPEMREIAQEQITEAARLGEDLTRCPRYEQLLPHIFPAAATSYQI